MRHQDLDAGSLVALRSGPTSRRRLRGTPFPDPPKLLALRNDHGGGRANADAQRRRLLRYLCVALDGYADATHRFAGPVRGLRRSCLQVEQLSFVGSHPFVRPLAC